MELVHHARADGRLSDILKNEMGVSSGLMNRLKWDGRLRVNGEPRRTDFRVKAGDAVSLLLDEEEPDYPAEEMELTILYEDAHLLAVDKPAGMLIHPSRAVNTGTLANYVLGYYQKTGQSCAFHPVTRLDRDTFGVVLLAKNAHIHGLLNQLHSEGKLQKNYRALVLGCPHPEEGRIDAPISRLPLPSLLRQVHPEGKPSVTEYAVEEKFSDYSKLTLRPITGRTHQLRVHCSYMGFPILGDPQYGNEASLSLSKSLGIQTQALCAWQLSFSHPITGEKLIVNTKFDI